MKLLKLFALFCFTAALTSAQSIPAIKAKALDNSEIILPNPGSQQLLILIVGFSQKSGKLCEVWSRKISADYHSDARIAYFSLPILQSAPSLVRPLIVYGIRKGLPAEERRRFVPIYSNESDWKKLVNFSAPAVNELLPHTSCKTASRFLSSHGPMTPMHESRCCLEHLGRTLPQYRP